MQNNKPSRNSIQLIRNATLIIQYAGKKILVDPMFFPKYSFNPFAGIAKNPTVELTIPVDDIIKDVDLVLVTHTHPDHFDQVAGAVIPAFETTPILMDEEGTITLVKASPKARVIAVHMEALDIVVPPGFHFVQKQISQVLEKIN